MADNIKSILNNDKQFTEICRQAFNSVDVDHSGQIDEKELQSVMEQIAVDMGAEKPNKDDVKEVLQHLDTDHSGKIDFNEFKKLIYEVLNAMVGDS